MKPKDKFLFSYISWFVRIGLCSYVNMASFSSLLVVMLDMLLTQDEISN